MSCVGVFYNVCLYDVGVVEGPNGSIFFIVYWFYICFVKIDVSLWRVASVRILFIVLCALDDFGERHNSLICY